MKTSRMSSSATCSGLRLAGRLSGPRSRRLQPARSPHRHSTVGTEADRYRAVCHGSVSRVVKFQSRADTAVAHGDKV